MCTFDLTFHSPLHVMSNWLHCFPNSHFEGGGRQIRKAGAAKFNMRKGEYKGKRATQHTTKMRPMKTCSRSWSEAKVNWLPAPSRIVHNCGHSNSKCYETVERFGCLFIGCRRQSLSDIYFFGIHVGFGASWVPSWPWGSISTTVTAFLVILTFKIVLQKDIQSGYIGCNTGNGEKQSNSQAYGLAQLCLAAA